MSHVSVDDFGDEPSDAVLNLLRWVREVFPWCQVVVQREDPSPHRWEATFADDEMEGPVHLIDGGDAVEVWAYPVGGCCEQVGQVPVADWLALFDIVSPFCCPGSCR